VIVDANGNTRTWRTLWPYPTGNWVTNVQAECGSARALKVGTYRSTDFTLNSWQKKETPPFTLRPKPGEFVSKVIMSGGFYDPRLPGARSGASLGLGLCVRSKDPTVFERDASGALFNPPWGNGLLPIGCIANGRIVNTPGAYSVSATAAYPEVDTYFPGGDNTTVSGPYTYGSQLVVTTDITGTFNDMGSPSLPLGAPLLTYSESASIVKPLAGTLSVWVCLDHGSPWGGPDDQ
jgi:hypothetical protein